jgi:hypothetical protein
LEAFQADLEQAARDGDPLTSFLVEQVMVAHQLLRGKSALAMVRRLYDIAMETNPPNVFAGAMMHAAYVLADNLGGPVDVQALASFRAMVERYYDEVEHLRLKGHARNQTYVANNLRGYAELFYRHHRRLEVDLIQKYSQCILKTPDTQMALNFLHDIAGMVYHANAGYRQVGWQALRDLVDFTNPIFAVPDSMQADEDSWQARIAAVRDRVQRKQAPLSELLRILGRARVRYPRELDNFLAEFETQIPEAFKRRIEAIEAQEQSGEAITTNSLAMQIEAMKMPTMRAAFLWAIDRACESPNMRDWTQILARRVVNIAYGETIFPEAQMASTHAHGQEPAS